MMTSMAFILGVLPLLVRPRRRRRDAASAGDGRLQRHARRDAFGILLTPVFFYLIDTVSESHLFASPRVRRIGGIALVILILVVVPAHTH